MSEEASASSNSKRSKKRKYVGSRKDGNSNKRRKLDYEVDLTKGRNIILCSTEGYKEVLAGKDLQLVFTEYIEEFLKQKKETEKNETSVAGTKNVEETQTNDDKKEKDVEKKDEENENEDDDLEINKNKNDDKQSNKQEKDDDENEDDDLNAKENKNENETNDNKQSVSIADSIKNELKNFNKNKLCEWIKGPTGLVVIDIKANNVPATALLEFVFDKFAPKRPNLSPFVYKLFPMDCTSFSRQNDMIELGKKMIEKFDWSKISKEDPYAIVYKNRANKSLNRMEIVTGIAEFVPDGYTVDLKNPKTVILLQTFGRNCGLSVIPNGVFSKHKGYCLSSFTD